jgi:hypothetical protein
LTACTNRYAGNHIGHLRWALLTFAVLCELRSIVRIYVFKSETTARLRAFAGDPDVNKLPRQHGPWTATGTISPDNAPPYNFSRDAIEKAINTEGFQLWRLRDKK